MKATATENIVSSEPEPLYGKTDSVVTGAFSVVSTEEEEDKMEGEDAEVEAEAGAEVEEEVEMKDLEEKEEEEEDKEEETELGDDDVFAEKLQKNG